MRKHVGLAVPRARGPAESRSAELTAATADLAAAATSTEVGGTAAQHAVALTGARGAAVGMLAPSQIDVVLVGAVGYECDAMEPGRHIPLDSGLPLTEAVRTRAPVVAGEPGGPGWAALPLQAGPRTPGALLVSLAPGSRAPDLAALATLARHAGRALQRARRYDEALQQSAAVTAAVRLRPLPAPAGMDVAARLLPLSGDVGGDLIEVVPDDRGGCWVVVADVCGTGPEAAVVLATVRPAVRALAAYVEGPVELLGRLDRLLTEEPGVDRFVTAVAARLVPDAAGVRVCAASAGHPLPLQWTRGSVQSHGTAGPPLGLGLEDGGPALEETGWLLSPDSVLLLHTDGLIDRRSRTPGDVVLPELFAGVAGIGNAETVADAVLHAMSAVVGPARDDVAILVIRSVGGASG